MPQSPISRRKVLDLGYVELLNYMGDDSTIVSAARVSYLRTTKGEDKDKKLLKYLMENEHWTPYEQVELQWRVKSPLFVAAQWMRHRTWHYNQLSRRYSSEMLEFYYPQDWRLQDESNKQASYDLVEDKKLQKYCNDSTKQIVKDSLTHYKKMLDDGVAREMARMILPQNLYTVFYAKVDLRNLLHFIDLRADRHAQYEIRVYAEAMEEMLDNVVPWTMEIRRELRSGGG